ncbi:exodeoxyribonuclease VII large subunit [Evansella cellulosilytica]|uniref:Exodeoxyribonuclease 7 large subunit n=1 Tax=Evansella cellulosilytica (strain ATCC 21833 / DSM 2522 / FERM P-1141 / JCM 9156 / N-4) TaxID=649639 RepID=E6TXQ2_EVAC2|nr:exodeoxyribonuclease VII large subunit [Evansella cellulosilytica]ADU29978.1 exodeoxyribonuclease VII, large subunit [Evansella cellulosilytica DSM 2522]
MDQEFLSVSDVTRRIKRLVETDAVLQNVWLRAEISNFKWHSRGHMYFTLKDDKSRINSVMFAGNNRYLKFTPENGMNVLVRGDISVYEPHGQYQLYVKEMQPDGIGNLYLAYEELKKKLEMAGYFSRERKKAIPTFPKTIAVATSPTGAAVRDILTTVHRRFPLTKVILLPVLVQGPEAAPSIARAIKQANFAGIFDVMIIGRGGGSLEELWAFNEQIVAEAIYESKIPIISAVGHETDVTISDFVADLRAPTPTAAAELAVPHIHELLKRVQDQRSRLIQTMDRLKSVQRERLGHLSKSYAFKYPKRLIEQKEQDLDRLVELMTKTMMLNVDKQKDKLQGLKGRIQRMHPTHKLLQERKRISDAIVNLRRAMNETINSKQSRFSLSLSKLELLSPLQMMKRGYNLAYNEENNLIKKLEDVKENEPISIRLQDGKLSCHVTEKSYDPLPNIEWRGEESEK